HHSAFYPPTPPRQNEPPAEKKGPSGCFASAPTLIQAPVMSPRLLYVVTEDWYFLSHRLPMARAARNAGYEVHVATRIKDGRAGIEREGFVPHALSWSRGSLSAAGSLSAVRELRHLFGEIDPDILHNISLKPVLLGTTASLG